MRRPRTRRGFAPSRARGRRMEAHLPPPRVDALAIADRLRGAGEILAVAQAHDVERFPRRQHGAVAGARVIGMAMRDQRLLDWPRRIDVKAAELAADAGRGRGEDVFGTHRLRIGTCRQIARRSNFPASPSDGTRADRLEWGDFAAEAPPQISPARRLAAGSPRAAGRRARISSNCWPRRSRALGAADRADRRRQDAGGFPADARGIVLQQFTSPRGEGPPRRGRNTGWVRGRTKRQQSSEGPLIGPWDPPPPSLAGRRRIISAGRGVRRAGRAAHALYFALEGARRRHRPQSRNAGARNESADPAGDPHRRHAGIEAPAPAPRSARHSADDAGATRPAARHRRCAVPVRLAQARRARRIAFAGHLETRRSAVARPGAAVRAGAGPHHRRPLGDGRRAGRTSPLSGAAAAGRRARADLVVAQAGAQPQVAMLDTAEHLPWAGHSARHALTRNLRADQDAQDDADLRQYAQPGRIPLPGAVGRQRRQSRHCAASWLARCRAAPQGRRCHDAPANCARWCAPPRSISASTGATSIW